MTYPQRRRPGDLTGVRGQQLAKQAARDKSEDSQPVQLSSRSVYRQPCPDEVRDALLEIQDGRCPCCDAILSELHPNPNGSSRVHVEHDPVTGRLRGIVCQRDNTRLHQLDSGTARRETYENLDRLERYREHPPAYSLPADMRNFPVPARPIANVTVGTTITSDVADTFTSIAAIENVSTEALFARALKRFVGEYLGGE